MTQYLRDVAVFVAGVIVGLMACHVEISMQREWIALLEAILWERLQPMKEDEAEDAEELVNGAEGTV